MRPADIRLRALLLFPILFAVPLSAQEDPEQATSRPRVFFDCQGFRCDDDYYRTEIPWVNWVLDREDADVHVIMTSQATGAGGREYQLDLIGREDVSDYEDQAFYASLPTNTERETLDGISYTLSVALARFAVAAGYPPIVDLEAVDERAAAAQRGVVSAGQVEDPWDLWVFRINGNANLDGEETQQTVRLNSSFSASRVTPTWKLDFDGNVNFRSEEFERSDETTFTRTQTDWGFDALVAYSLADHWSVGMNLSTGRLNRFNQDFRVEFLPAVEYSYFPYPEATRRSLTAFYEIGPAYRNYQEKTIFLELEETRFEHSLEIEFSQRQPWGEASFSVEGSHFLDNVDQNRLSLDGDIDYRISRGFSVNVRGDIAWVNDQIYLSAQDETDEEVLLRLRQRGTDFEWGVQVGFSYQFGSIFNNVVNNRFGGGGGGFGGFRGFGGGFR